MRERFRNIGDAALLKLQEHSVLTIHCWCESGGRGVMVSSGRTPFIALEVGGGYPTILEEVGT